MQRRALALNDVTGDDTIKAEIKALADDPAGTKKLLAVAAKIAKQKDQPFTYNAAYILAQAAYLQKDLDTSTALYRICIQQSLKLNSGKKLAQSYEGLINLLSQHKKYDDVAKVCLEFLELPEEGNQNRPVQELKSAVYRRLIQSLARAGQYDKAHKLVDNLLENRPGSWQLLDLRGFIQREAGEFDKAAKTYEQIKDRVTKDKELSDDERSELIELYRYTLSSVYVDCNKVDKAAEQLKALLAAKPDDPTYNNDLGYIWADHNLNLDEAERLIRKALEEDRKRRKANPDAGRGRPRQPRLPRQHWVGSVQEEEVRGGEEVPAPGDQGAGGPAHRDSRPSGGRPHGAGREEGGPGGVEESAGDRAARAARTAAQEGSREEAEAGAATGARTAFPLVPEHQGTAFPLVKDWLTGKGPRRVHGEPSAVVAAGPG